MQARRRAQRLAQAIQVGLANHEGRALEAAAVVVGAEADADAAGRLALRAGEEPDRGLMPIAHVARLLDDLAAAPVHLDPPRQLAAWRHSSLLLSLHILRPPTCRGTCLLRSDKGAVGDTPTPPARGC